MTSDISIDSLNWIRAHKKAIQGIANHFLHYAVDSRKPFGAPRVQPPPKPKTTLEWANEDQGMEIILGCSLAFDCCGSALPVAILNRLVNALTNYKAGSSVFSMLTNLVGKQIAIIEVDKIGFVKNAMKMMDVYVSLAPTAFETLSELSIPEETTEVFHPHKDFENRSIPALLLQLGQILQKRIHEQWQVDLALLKRTSRSEFDAFIPAVSEHLAARLNRCDFLMRRLNMTPLEPVDAQIMALLFVVRLASISDRMTPKCVAAGIEGDFEARIRVIRRIRNGILVRSGIIQDPLQSGLLLDEEVFDDLLELDGEDN